MNDIGANPADGRGRRVWGGGLIAALGLALFVWAYLPSARIPFRVEQWDCYDFYQSYPFDAARLYDWGLMAFWTPFGDFRPIPLAYLWNFLTFTLLGPQNLWFWVLSLTLTVVNATLLARWVSALRGHDGLGHGLIAATLFLLMPAPHEIVIWTFFTYKLVNTTLVLVCLIFLEKFLVTRQPGAIYLATSSLAVSWLFYEATIPIALALPIRMALCGRSFTRSDIRRVLLSIGVAITGYAVFYLAAIRWIPRAYNLAQQIPRQQVGLDTFLVSAWRWVVDGVLLGNAGLPLTSVVYPYHLGFRPVAELTPIVVILMVWGALLAQLRWRPFPIRDLVFLGVVAGAGSVLVWVGRTMTNGPDYLAGFSIYQHFPTLVLAAAVGYLIDRSGISGKGMVVAVLLVVTLLGISSRQAVDEYMHGQEPLLQALATVEQALRTHPEARIYVGEIHLPFAPTWSIPSALHSYHAFHLLHGDRITLERP
ncbi:MAG TPA: hypothetical protein VIG07_18585 [Methylomirabilota bacterium]|jgi:hypothetical protein